MNRFVLLLVTTNKPGRISLHLLLNSQLARDCLRPFANSFQIEFAETSVADLLEGIAFCDMKLAGSQRMRNLFNLGVHRQNQISLARFACQKKLPTVPRWKKPTFV